MTQARIVFQRRLASVQDALFGYALALTRDRETARDLFQDCVVNALAAGEEPCSGSAFKSWIFSIMRHRWIDVWRSDRRHWRHLHAMDPSSPDRMRPEADPDLSAVIVNRLAVRRAFDDLAPAHRHVLALIDIAGFTYQEAAEVLGVPHGTVMSRVSRARRELCRRLAQTDVTLLRAGPARGARGR
jgi:RNA polymerase sigma-70 factor, ECF subfamily